MGMRRQDNLEEEATFSEAVVVAREVYLAEPTERNLIGLIAMERNHVNYEFRGASPDEIGGFYHSAVDKIIRASNKPHRLVWRVRADTLYEALKRVWPDYASRISRERELNPSKYRDKGEIERRLEEE